MPRCIRLLLLSLLALSACRLPLQADAELERHYEAAREACLRAAAERKIPILGAEAVIARGRRRFDVMMRRDHPEGREEYERCRYNADSGTASMR